MTDIPIDELSNSWESIAHDVMKEHEKRFADRIKTIRDAANALDNVAGRLGVAVRNAWGTMDAAASEYGMRMVESIRESTQELFQTQASPAFADAEKFHKASVDSLNKIIKTVRRYIPKLHRGLRTEMAALNSALGRLEASVVALGTALDESPGSKIEVIRREAQGLIEKHHELEILRTEAETAVTSLQTISQKENGLRNIEQKLISQEPFLELEHYENSLQRKEEEIKQFFQPVTKPLVKLERIALPRGSPPIDSKTVHGIVDAPVEIISSGQPFVITQLFERLDEALLQGKVEVEERRRRRAEETIKEVKNGAIGKMREEYLTAQANVQEMLRQLRGNGLLDQKEQLDRQVAETKQGKDRITSHRDDINRRINDLSKNILRQKTLLEEQISKITKKTSTILTD